MADVSERLELLLGKYLGLAAALIVGAAIGVLMGLSRVVDLAFSDLNAAALAIPAVIWALLTTMWFGFGWLTPVVTVFLSGLPFVVVNIAKATRAVPADLVLMARSFGVPQARVLREIVAERTPGTALTSAASRESQSMTVRVGAKGAL